MSDAVPTDLAAYIERAIGAIPASASRKRRMREELLAHLLDIYDEELERLHDERTAAARTKQRFGLPDDLRNELTAAVPWVERLFLLLFGKGNLMARWLWMYFVGVLAVFVGFGFILPAIQQLRDPAPIMPNNRFGIGVLMPFGVVLSVVGVLLMGYNLRKGFRLRRSRSTSRPNGDNSVNAAN